MILPFFSSLSSSEILSLSQYSGSSSGLLGSQFESASTMSTSSYHSSEPEDHIYLADQSDEDPATCRYLERTRCKGDLSLRLQATSSNFRQSVKR